MTTLALVLMVGYPAPSEMRVGPSYTGIVHGDIMLVYLKGEVVDMLDHCHGNQVGEMQLLNHKTGKFQVCAQVGKLKSQRYWVLLPREVPR